jgi:hypothetical protein
MGTWIKTQKSGAEAGTSLSTSHIVPRLQVKLDHTSRRIIVDLSLHRPSHLKVDPA